MTHPSINEAKALAYKHRKQAVLIISFGDDQVAGVSYGMTRSKCRAAAAVLKEIHERLSDGRIHVPDELGEPASAAPVASGPGLPFAGEGTR